MKILSNIISMLLAILYIKLIIFFHIKTVIIDKFKI